MKSPALTIGLYLNAAVMACGLIAWLARPSGPAFLPAAMGQTPPIAGGGSGIYLMPGQISPNAWGVYLMDTDAQTLMVYQFAAGDNLLRLKAARSFANDRRLKNYNTASPTPAEVKELLDREAVPGRGMPSGIQTGPTGSSGTGPTSDNK